jgi:hypothetical protein
MRAFDSKGHFLVCTHHTREQAPFQLQLTLNRQRLHSALGYRSPEEFEQQNQGPGMWRVQQVQPSCFSGHEEHTTNFLGEGRRRRLPQIPSFLGRREENSKNCILVRVNIASGHRNGTVSRDPCERPSIAPRLARQVGRVVARVKCVNDTATSFPV